MSCGKAELGEMGVFAPPPPPPLWMLVLPGNKFLGVFLYPQVKGDPWEPDPSLLPPLMEHLQSGIVLSMDLPLPVSKGRLIGTWIPGWTNLPA